jgi:hypothetical protein
LVSDETIYVSDFAEVTTIGSIDFIFVKPPDLKPIIRKQSIIRAIAKALTSPIP